LNIQFYHLLETKNVYSTKYEIATRVTFTSTTITIIQNAVFARALHSKECRQETK